jgi:hypothetical protein
VMKPVGCQSKSYLCVPVPILTQDPGHWARRVKALDGSIPVVLLSSRRKLIKEKRPGLGGHDCKSPAQSRFIGFKVVKENVPDSDQAPHFPVCECSPVALGRPSCL